MKGSLKTVAQQVHTHNKTDFNDWSDPKCIRLRRIKRSKEKEVTLDTPEEVITQKASISSQTSIEIEQLRSKIREGYPLLNQKEIRSVKLPFYESLLLNLCEDGFFAVFQFIKDLIDLDEEWHKQRGKNPSIKNRPFLKSNIPTLNSLCNGLTKAEITKRENNKTEEMRSWLDLAIHFSNPDDESWHWLSEELYLQCVNVADDDSTASLDQQLEATAKYMFAKFLLDVLHDPKRAKVYVEQSMQLSVGKFWNTSEITGEKSDILYFESCLLLHKIFLEMAKERKNYDIEDAIQLCRSSLHWAKQINCKPAEATALMNLVVIYIAAGQFNPVLGHLEKYMKICAEQNDIEGLCEGYILLATYHELSDQDDLVIEDIYKLLEIAEDNKIMKMMAKAHHKLATFYLIQGKEKELQQHAIQAYNYYVKLNSKLEMEETRCLTGIAQAHEIMSQYLNILLEAENVDIIEFRILLLWKTLRIPFFSNIKLFQPEAITNSELKDRIETMRNDELQTVNQARQAEMVTSLPVSLSRMTMRHVTSVSSTATRMSRSVLNFHRNLKSAIMGGGSTGSTLTFF